MADRIWVVDDDEDIVRVISVNLQLEGYDVSVAHDGQDGLEKALDNTHLLPAAAAAIENGEEVKLEFPIVNINRTVGAMLSGEIARKLLGDAPEVIARRAEQRDAGREGGRDGDAADG